ncbi:MAG TPA: hypothetical protein VLE91_03185 [Candidatus Saccharimonadales bacterium]|nr:hypothetical protein [Candidatus Saccharimonadales bacterium]
MTNGPQNELLQGTPLPIYSREFDASVFGYKRIQTLAFEGQRFHFRLQGGLDYPPIVLGQTVRVRPEGAPVAGLNAGTGMIVDSLHDPERGSHSDHIVGVTAMEGNSSSQNSGFLKTSELASPDKQLEADPQQLDLELDGKMASIAVIPINERPLIKGHILAVKYGDSETFVIGDYAGIKDEDHFGLITKLRIEQNRVMATIAKSHDGPLTSVDLDIKDIKPSRIKRRRD